MLCPLEKLIPPEAQPAHHHLDDVADADEGFRRFAEQVDDEITWNPDRAPAGHPDPDEYLQLENRGVTQPITGRPSPAARYPVQTELWRKQTSHKFSIAAKLRSVGMIREAEKLEDCHSYYTICRCNDCGTVRKFPNRCDLFYCPECQPGLARDRKRQVEWWTATINQPKHVVLTVKNIPTLERGHLDQVCRWFTALRRRKFARNWLGGFYSLEITNEGKGWHIHIHALVDARWIDSAQLALQWDSITNGLGRIVKVMDCRNASYLAEVTKYAVKGSQLAAWDAQRIAQFLIAMDGKRTFGVFGSLYGARTEFAEFIATMKAARPKCECGSCAHSYFSESQWLLMQLEAGPAPTRPPPPNEPQICLPLSTSSSWPD